jgi:hypothetical protein
MEPRTTETSARQEEAVASIINQQGEIMHSNHADRKLKLLPTLTGIAVLVLGLAGTATPSAAAAGATLNSKTKFFVPPPDSAAVQQGIELLKKRNLQGTLELAAMLAQGHAVWFTSWHASGSAAERAKDHEGGNARRPGSRRRRIQRPVP